MLHDYGMGGLWWWVWAGSAEEIVRDCAEVEVIADPERLAWAERSGLKEVRLDGPELASFCAKRDAQRGRPGFGALVGRELVHLRWPADEDGDVYLAELGPDGRRTRQVVIGVDGDVVRSTPEDWLFNPPYDLYDPEHAEAETDRADFEREWARARREA
ncbi:hypothetical protein GCM10009738_08470 [Kitasatospora viridis]